MRSTEAAGEVAARVADTRSCIAAAAERSGRDPAAVRLIAVTKTVDAARVREAIDAGVTDIGENRVQEAVTKRDALPGSLRWHLIGHLQTNKAARAASAFDTVHSIDAARVATALATRRPESLPPLDVLLEVELTGLPGHTGFGEQELAEAVREIAAIPRLRLCGLMTMAPPVAHAEGARPTFARLRTIRDDLQQRTAHLLAELSMGMSGDYEVAVEEGATMVRLGRALFGERPQRHGQA